MEVTTSDRSGSDDPDKVAHVLESWGIFGNRESFRNQELRIPSGISASKGLRRPPAVPPEPKQIAWQAQSQVESAGLSKLEALLTRFESSADELSSATASFLKETSHAQLQMQEMIQDMTKAFEQKIAVQLEHQKQSFDNIKDQFRSLHESFIDERVSERVSTQHLVSSSSEILGANSKMLGGNSKNSAFDASIHEVKMSLEDDAEIKKELGRSGRMSIHCKHVSEYCVPPPPQSILLDIVHSAMFEGMAFVVIFSNALILGVQTNLEVDYALQKPPQASPEWISHVNRTVLVFFMIELLIRIMAERLYFFLGMNWSWNLFDSLMVAGALVEEVVDTGGTNLSTFRILRILKIARAVRILRLFRHLRDLRIMVRSIALSFKSLVWALFLLGILVYGTSVVLCQAVAVYYRSGPFNEHHAEDSDLRVHYGTVPRAMYSLILAISGGKDWYDLAVPLKEVDSSGMTLAMFICYTLFVVFGMLNVLTGVFVDRASELSKMDREIIVESEKFKVQNLVHSFKEAFAEADADGSGNLSSEEFHTYARRPEVRAFFASMGLEVDDAKNLFALIDAEQKGSVNIMDFISGCLRVKGIAKSIDVMSIQSSINGLKRMVLQSYERVEVAVALLEASNARLRAFDRPFSPYHLASPTSMGKEAEALANSKVEEVEQILHVSPRQSM